MGDMVTNLDWTSDDSRTRILLGDCLDRLRGLPSGSVHCCVTSPPYWWLRDYGVDGQMGLEQTPEEYTRRMVDVFAEVRRVLRDDGTCWLNLGDSYAGGAGGRGDVGNVISGTQTRTKPVGAGIIKNAVPVCLKPKDLIGIPWRVAFALQADGWYLRQDIIWHKPNPMPESVRDRCTKAHEYVFLLAKSQRYFFDAGAIVEAASNTSGWARQRGKGVNTWDYGRDGYTETRIGGMRSGKETYDDKSTRNRRSVWSIATKPYSGAHFACMPPDLARLCILAGCPVGGTVLDPFAGSGTTLQVARWLDRCGLGIELNEKYIELAKVRALTPEGKQIRKAPDSLQATGLLFQEIKTP